MSFRTVIFAVSILAIFSWTQSTSAQHNTSSMMLLPEGTGSTVLSVPFYLDNASNFVGGNVPNDGSASFVGVKNMSGVAVTLTLTYTDTGGNDHTPVVNTYVLAANSMVSWRPAADDPIEGNSSGRLVPNTDGGPSFGSVRIDADGPITGRLITLDGIQNSTSMMLLPAGGGSTTVSVPFYLDNASNFVGGAVPSDGSASFIGTKKYE